MRTRPCPCTCTRPSLEKHSQKVLSSTTTVQAPMGRQQSSSVTQEKPSSEQQRVSRQRKDSPEMPQQESSKRLQEFPMGMPQVSVMVWEGANPRNTLAFIMLLAPDIKERTASSRQAKQKGDEKELHSYIVAFQERPTPPSAA